MLCMVKSPPKHNYSKIGNWEHRFERSDDHLFPQLRRHYLAYQQRMQQISVMERTLLSRLHISNRLSILSTAISLIEFDLENQFDT